VGGGASLGAGSGAFVTETFEHDGGRQVTVYVPPDPPEAIVFAGDRQVISPWGGDLVATDVPPTIVVGVHRPVDEMLRLQEYSPGFDPERFAAHETFLVRDVRRRTETRFGVALPSERTAMFGVSASGLLALAMGLRPPHVFCAVFCASPGAGYQPPAAMPARLPAYVHRRRHAGAVLPRNATLWATAIRDAGGDVVMNERDGSHGDVFWHLASIRGSGGPAIPGSGV